MPAYNTDNLPVVSWNQEADGWRLPTEAEWEYLCRARSTTAFANGDITIELSQDEQGNPDPNLDRIGWYHGNANHSLHTVSEVSQAKEANSFGLYDMHGNVAEWCWDYYGPYPTGTVFDPTGPETGELRVIRGGHWDAHARDCRSAARGYHYPNSGDDYLGFRVVRTSDTPWPTSR
jgi:formylglycine-generating enzyme required for sulfatase activity